MQSVVQSTPALQLTALSKSFYEGGPVVDELSLQIAPGTFYALLGPNGAGKTTTLRMIAGLLRPDRGDVFVFGASMIHHPEEAKKWLAFVPDTPPLYEKLRPLEYLEFVAGLWELAGREVEAEACELLQKLGLWDVREKFTESFSRGQRQRLALAGAFVHRPQIVLLDEPLTGLDAAAIRVVREMLIDFVQQGNTVLLTTHALDVVERLAQKVGIIKGGKLLAEGTLEELRTRTGEEGRSLEDVYLSLVGSET